MTSPRHAHLAVLVTAVVALAGCISQGAVERDDPEPVVARELIPVGTPMHGALVTTDDEVQAAEESGLGLVAAETGGYWVLDPDQPVPPSVSTELTGRLAGVADNEDVFSDTLDAAVQELTDAGLTPALVVPVTWGAAEPVRVVGVADLQDRDWTLAEATGAIEQAGYDLVDLTGASR